MTSTTNEVTVDTGDTGGGTAEPGDELLVRPPVSVDAQDNVFYFVMPDRFDNGDPSNDAAATCPATRSSTGSTRRTRVSTTAATSPA